jgi:hypothetical protein
MIQFEYEITKHPADTFKEVIYFCSEKGLCSLEHIPSDQVRRIEHVLNERGRQGWELAHVSFGKDGVLAFWKRMINSKDEVDVRTPDSGVAMELAVKKEFKQ